MRIEPFSNVYFCNPLIEHYSSKDVSSIVKSWRLNTWLGSSSIPSDIFWNCIFLLHTLINSSHPNPFYSHSSHHSVLSHSLPPNHISMTSSSEVLSQALLVLSVVLAVLCSSHLARESDSLRKDDVLQRLNQGKINESFKFHLSVFFFRRVT